MSSIANVLSSISSLYEIGTDLSAAQIASSVFPSSTTTGSSSPDSVNFSQAAELLKQLRELHASDSTAFTDATANAVSQLQRAAQQSTDPSEANFLSKLADEFQQASEGGHLPFSETGLGTQDGSAQDAVATPLSGSSGS